MALEFHSVEDVQRVLEASEFKFPRAKEIAQAIAKNRDCTLVNFAKRTEDDCPTWEIIVVDVECDRVPPNNSPGILYKERLALFVPKDPTRLVEVIALRKDFPVMIHQNHGVEGGAANLCLYFDTPSSVLRTWTAEKFLRQIQWWLEASSRENLHSSDQPVEHLFFASKFELVLPWNFDDLQSNEKLKLEFSKTEERVNGGITFFLNQNSPNKKEARVSCFEFTLPSIVHGFIEKDPYDLGSLVDYLNKKGFDLFSTLKTRVQERVGFAGANPSEDEQCTIVLLHIPVSRIEGGHTERTIRRAFITMSGSLGLGKNIGALFKLDNKYFNAIGVMEQADALSWRAQPVCAMDVLFIRAQSVTPKLLLYAGFMTR
jgi:hypothetical protein